MRPLLFVLIINGLAKNRPRQSLPMLAEMTVYGFVVKTKSELIEAAQILICKFVNCQLFINKEEIVIITLEPEIVL